MKKTFEKACYADHFEGKIFMTEKFRAAAGKYGSPEFEWFVGLRNMCPNYVVELFVAAKKEKVDYNGLSIEKMLAFIEEYKTETEKTTFESYIRTYTDEDTLKIEKGKYATIKRLFLNSYKNEYNNLDDEQHAELDGKAKEIKKARDEEREAALEKRRFRVAKANPEVSRTVELKRTN